MPAQMIINADFDIGDTVYLDTDREQIAYKVVGYVVHQHDTLYILGSPEGSYQAFNFEISSHKKLVE